MQQLAEHHKPRNDALMWQMTLPIAGDCRAKAGEHVCAWQSALTLELCLPCASDSPMEVASLPPVWSAAGRRAVAAACFAGAALVGSAVACLAAAAAAAASSACVQQQAAVPHALALVDLGALCGLQLQSIKPLDVEAAAAQTLHFQ